MIGFTAMSRWACRVIVFTVIFVGACQRSRPTGEKPTASWSEIQPLIRGKQVCDFLDKEFRGFAKGSSSSLVTSGPIGSGLDSVLGSSRLNISVGRVQSLEAARDLIKVLEAYSGDLAPIELVSVLHLLPSPNYPGDESVRLREHVFICKEGGGLIYKTSRDFVTGHLDESASGVKPSPSQ